MTSATRSRPPGLPSDAQILGRAAGENFTVASRLLSRTSRHRLVAFYGYARLVDEIGDAYAGDRLAALAWVDAEVDAAWTDPTASGRHSLVAAAAAAARDSGAPVELLHDLVEANRIDQSRSRWDSWEDLLGYCRLSARPVGRLVLAAFDAATPERMARSDEICSALQVVEHLQDIAEDAIAGRIYLPADDMDHFGVAASDLVGLAGRRSAAPAALRGLVAYEASRARDLLDRGSRLLGLLRGRSRIATAGFAAGGYATLDALEAAGWDPLPATPRPRPARVAAHAVRLLRPGAGGPA